MSSAEVENGDSPKGSESTKVFTIALCLGFVAIEVLMQTITYATKELHGQHYPIPSSTIVLLSELCKFSVCFILFVRQASLKSFTPSLIFAIPSVLYTINNNLYLYSLKFMPPPTWNNLLQMRVIMTALVYRFIFKREIGFARCLALLLLLLAIILAESSGLSSISSAFFTFTVNGFLPDLRVTVLGLIGSVISTTAAVTIEYLYKNGARSFVEKQVQLYFFGGFFALLWSLYMTNGHPLTINETLTFRDVLFVGFTITLRGFGGLMVALIVKHVDNIAKIYSASMALIITACMCAIIFPHEFKLKIHFFFAVAIMCFSLVLYGELAVPKKM